MMTRQPQYNWQGFERRPTWGYVSVQELAQVLGISPQSIHNWIGRGKLPQAEIKPDYKGNKRFFQIARIRSFLEGKTEEQVHKEWVSRMLPEYADNVKAAKFYVNNAWDLFGVEKP